jgi:hypothetical protein
MEGSSLRIFCNKIKREIVLGFRMGHFEIKLQKSIHSLPILYDTEYRSSLANMERKKLTELGEN